MTIDQAAFFTSFLFLTGIIMMIASSFMAVRERFPKLFMQGFLLTIAGIALMVVASFLLS